jgi:periplasmic protein TonB
MQTPINMPNIDFARFGGGAALGGFGGFAAAATGGDTGLVPLARVQPQYPQRAALEGIEGYVVFSVTITETGDVVNASVVESQPRGWGFEQAAMRAITRTRFRAEVVDGRPQRTTGTYRFDFTLSD